MISVDTQQEVQKVMVDMLIASILTIRFSVSLRSVLNIFQFYPHPHESIGERQPIYEMSKLYTPFVSGYDIKIGVFFWIAELISKVILILLYSDGSMEKTRR